MFDVSLRHRAMLRIQLTWLASLVGTISMHMTCTGNNYAHDHHCWCNHSEWKNYSPIITEVIHPRCVCQIIQKGPWWNEMKSTSHIHNKVLCRSKVLDFFFLSYESQYSILGGLGLAIKGMFLSIWLCILKSMKYFRVAKLIWAWRRNIFGNLCEST